MVFYRVTVIGIQSLQVVTRNHAIDTRSRRGPQRVDGNNLRVGVRAAQDLGVGHADEFKVGDIGGFAGDFNPAVAARYRMVDDVKISFLFGAHALTQSKKAKVKSKKLL